MNLQHFFFSNVLQKYFKSRFLFLFLFINCVKNRGIQSENVPQISHQGNKIGELRLTHCSLKVSFRGQRNPKKCKNLNKITSFRESGCLSNYMCTFVTFVITPLLLDIVQPAGLFQKTNALWYAQNYQWVQHSIFQNEKLISPFSFSMKSALIISSIKFKK